MAPPLFGPAQHPNANAMLGSPAQLARLRHMAQRAREMQQAGVQGQTLRRALGVVATGLGFTGAAIGEAVRYTYNYVTTGEDTNEPVELGTGPAATSSRLRGTYPDPEGPTPRRIDLTSDTDESEQKEDSSDEFGTMDDDNNEAQGDISQQEYEDLWTHLNKRKASSDIDERPPKMGEQPRMSDTQPHDGMTLNLSGQKRPHSPDSSQSKRSATTQEDAKVEHAGTVEWATAWDNIRARGERPPFRQVPGPWSMQGGYPVTSPDNDPNPNMGDTNMSVASDAQVPERLAIGGPAATNGGIGNRITPPSHVPPSMPWHSTEGSILEYHGSLSFNYLRKVGVGDNYLKIRMNTHITPFLETAANVANQVRFTAPTTALSPQVIGRFVHFPGALGVNIDDTYHRSIGTFQDAMISNVAVPFLTQKVAGADWYDNHYGAYTVTKCEWTCYVETPYQVIKSNSATTVAATIEAGMTSNTWQMGPPCKTSARVFTHYTMQGDTIPPVNPPLNAATLAMERWFNVFEDKVTVPMNSTRVIKGTWFPGKVKHNVLNDADMEIWTAGGVAPATGHLEHLVIQIKESANTDSADETRICANVHINLKYYIQWKEPETQLSYPVPAGANPAGTVVNSRLLQADPTYNV